MKRTISLVPLGNAPTLLFEYDETTGTIAGRDAKLVDEIIANAERQRFVPIEPHPQGHLLGPIPYSAPDLAAIFGQWYELPDWLNAERPRGDPGHDCDADVQVIY